MNTKLDQELIAANNVLFNRYLSIIKLSDGSKFDKNYLKDFCEKALNTKMRVDKHSRWLGFVQGVLYGAGMININEERDYSRKVFQDIYSKHNIEQKSVSVNNENEDDLKIKQRIFIEIPIPIDRTSILGIESINASGEVYYTAAVLKDSDIEKIKAEKDPLERLIIYAESKLKVVYSPHKDVGLHNFINKDYVAPSIDEVLRKIRNFAFNEYGISRPVAKND